MAISAMRNSTELNAKSFQHPTCDARKSQIKVMPWPRIRNGRFTPPVITSF